MLGVAWCIYSGYYSLLNISDGTAVHDIATLLLLLRGILIRAGGQKMLLRKQFCRCSWVTKCRHVVSWQCNENLQTCVLYLLIWRGNLYIFSLLLSMVIFFYWRTTFFERIYVIHFLIQTNNNKHEIVSFLWFSFTEILHNRWSVSLEFMDSRIVLLNAR